MKLNGFRMRDRENHEILLRRIYCILVDSQLLSFCERGGYKDLCSRDTGDFIENDTHLCLSRRHTVGQIYMRQQELLVSEEKIDFLKLS